MTTCSCIVSFKRASKQELGKCRNVARREMKVFQENEHGQIGTGWYWVPLCDKHFFGSKVSWSTMKMREDWRWL